MGRDDQGVAASRQRYQVIPRTLCFVTCGSEVLLLRGGPRKRLWAGLYNGLGGHVERGEAIRDAAIREVKEEAGIDVRDVCLRAVVHADAGDPLTGVLFFVFTAAAENKAVIPSAEGALAWFPMDALPLAAMVEDLPALLPAVLAMPPDAPPSFAAYSYDEQDRLVIRFSPIS